MLHSNNVAVSLVVVLFCSHAQGWLVPKKDTMDDLTTKQGYPMENHTVTTEDGYIRTMHRIPHGPKTAVPGKKVILLHHGVLMSSDHFVLGNPQQSLGYWLADRGYDVWMPNSRGNLYGRGHKTLNVFMKKFWNYGIDETGKYDFPADMDYILKETGATEIDCMGVITGASTLLSGLVFHPDYNSKCRTLTLVSPFAFVGNLKSNLHMAGLLADLLKMAYNTLINQSGELLRSYAELAVLTYTNCELGQNIRACRTGMADQGGGDRDMYDDELVRTFWKHAPTGVSTKYMQHVGQLMNAKVFQQYDWIVGNMFHYGKLAAPRYDLMKVTAPTILIWSEADKIVSRPDILELQAQLPNVKELYIVKRETWGNMDYFVAKDAEEQYFIPFERLIRSYGERMKK